MSMVNLARGPDYQAYADSFNPLGDAATAQANVNSINAAKAAPVAGQQVAAGDYAGAASTMFSAGDFKTGAAIQQLGGAVGQGKALAARDYQGAANAAGASGDVAGVGAAQQAALQQFQLRHQYIQRATPIFNAAYQKFGAGGIVHAIDQLTPDLTDPAIGITPNQINAYKQQAVTDPQGFLSSINTLASRKITYQKVGDNTILPTFEDNGQPAGAPITGAQNIPVPAGDSVMRVDPSGAAASAGGATGQPAIAAAVGSVTNPAVNKDALTRTAMLESRGNPNASNPSGASGMFQFMPKTAQGFGLTDPTNPTAAAQAAGEYQVQASKILAPVLGRTPTGSELYLAHQQGPAGAAALLQNPAQNAVDALTPLYGSAAKASAAITQNGGTPDMTAGQFTNMWANKYQDAAPAQQAASGAQPAATAGSAVTPIVPGVSLYTPGNGQPPVRDATPEENAAQGNAQGAGQITTIGKDAGKYTVVTKGGDVNNWTPQAIDRAADRYRFTGQLDAQASRGAGDQAAVQQIINLADQKDQAEGISPTERIARQALVNGAIKTQGDLIDNISKMQSYARNANDDFDNVAQLAQAGLASGQVKTVRDLQQWVATQQGSSALGKLNVALNDATGNYNKVVLGSGTGAGAAPGSKDEREVTREELFPDTLPIDTMLGNIEQAKVGINNRVNEQGRQYQLNEQIIKTGKFNPAAGNPATAAPQAAPGAQQAPAGRVIMYGPNGQRVQ